jgi:transcription factor C subunit 3
MPFINPNILFQGFLNPTKTDRRFFQSRLRELVETRVVERVMVPGTARSGTSSIPCIRLISDDNDAANELNVDPSHITPDPSTHDVLGSYARSSALSRTETLVDGSPSTIKLNFTLHKQIINLLENAGPKGMTLNVRIYCHPCLDIVRHLDRISLRRLEISTAVHLNYC